MPFGAGMVPPRLVKGVAPVMSVEAIQAGVYGTMLVKCVITKLGALTRCRIVKGLPFMDQAVLDAIPQWQYTPALVGGRPIAVEYVIPIRLMATPQR